MDWRTFRHGFGVIGLLGSVLRWLDFFARIRGKAKSFIPRKTMATALYVLLGLIVAVAISVLLVLLVHVEDWRRDLTTNVAATDENAPDSRMHPIRSRHQPVTLSAIVDEQAGSLPRWKLVQRSEEAGVITLHLVRTTPLMQYKDDIRVRIEPAAEGGSLLTAESRSRIGRGDLGQNPRNLRELLGVVRKACQ
jgi:uncharacterized protein (DUF1499 family)